MRNNATQPLWIVFLILIGACGHKLEPGQVSETTSDSALGTDGNTDTDSQTDSDTTSDNQPYFTVHEGGFVEAGVWHGYVDATTEGTGSTITPDSFDNLAAGGDLCVSGTVGAMSNWSGNALLSMNINEDAQQAGVNTWTPENTETMGLYVDISNPGSTEIRIKIETTGGASWCAVIHYFEGTFVPWSDFNENCWNNSGSFYSGEAISRISVLVPGHNENERPYHYCLNEMYPEDDYIPVIDTDVDTGEPLDTSLIPADWNVGFVGEHGMVYAQDSTLKDSHDQEIVLRGMSLFWSQWGGKYFNKETVDWLSTDWNNNIIRVPLGVNDETSGYLVNPTQEMKKVVTVVNAAIEAGIYVIIDWHDHNAASHPYDARAFFEVMAQLYGDYPNVIYEVWNEPLETHDWQNTIKPYAEFVIEGIRKHDPDNLILVGTTTWSQQVTDMIGHEIEDPNVAYVLHFYVGMHTSTLRSRTLTAKKYGLTIFVSEWGIWEGGGYIVPEDTDMEEWHGEVDTEALTPWLQWADEEKLSMCMWSAFDKDEPSAIIKPGTSTTGNWTADDLTTVGTYMYDVFNSYVY